jgi:hypothetical protein
VSPGPGCAWRRRPRSPSPSQSHPQGSVRSWRGSLGVQAIPRWAAPAPRGETPSASGVQESGSLLLPSPCEPRTATHPTSRALTHFRPPGPALLHHVGATWPTAAGGKPGVKLHSYFPSWSGGGGGSNGLALGEARDQVGLILGLWIFQSSSSPSPGVGDVPGGTQAGALSM